MSFIKRFGRCEYASLKNTPNNTSQEDNEENTNNNPNSNEQDEYEYVDLGLPSGTLWATMNIGASNVTDYDNYYMYGKNTTYNSEDTVYDGVEDPLDSLADVATQTWGGSWHMPTRAQMQELISNTTYQWVTNYKGSGINGGTFTATNGAVLFFPAAGYWYDGSQSNVGSYGYYWGSSPDGSYSAYRLYFSNGIKGVGNTDRELGCSVRPVKDIQP